MKLDDAESGAKVTAKWLDGAGVRAAARRRTRRRRFALGAGVAVVLVGLGVSLPLAIGASGGGPASVPPPALAGAHAVVGARLPGGVQLIADVSSTPKPDPATAGPVADAEQALSIALLQQLSKDAGGGNLSVSPASLEIALAMLQNGAAGKTQAQIQHALQSADLSTLQQNSGLAALTDEWRQAASTGHITLSSANSLFLQNGEPIRPQFLAALKYYYDAGTWQVDFAHQLGQAVDTINAWTKQQTHGKIAKLFEDGQLDASTVAVLANAVYFHAAWSQPFDPTDTSPRPFHGPAGDITVKFMTQTGGALPWSVGADYQAVELPYTGGRFAALAVMPTKGDLTGFVKGFSAERLADIASGLHNGGAVVSLPKFTTTSTLDLKSTLSALGMVDAFRPGADFSALSPAPLSVQAVEQRVYLAVGEKGTEAAAVTGIGIATSARAAASQTLTFDHPFLFLVRDTKTGAILFASLVQDPQG